MRLAEMQALNNLLTHPVYSFLVGFVTIEVLQAQGLVGPLAGSAAEAAIGLVAMAQGLGDKQIPPLLAGTIGGLALAGVVAGTGLPAVGRAAAAPRQLQDPSGISGGAPGFQG